MINVLNNGTAAIRALRVFCEETFDVTPDDADIQVLVTAIARTEEFNLRREDKKEKLVQALSACQEYGLPVDELVKEWRRRWFLTIKADKR